MQVIGEKYSTDVLSPVSAPCSNAGNTDDQNFLQVEQRNGSTDDQNFLQVERRNSNRIRKISRRPINISALSTSLLKLEKSA